MYLHFPPDCLVLHLSHPRAPERAVAPEHSDNQHAPTHSPALSTIAIIAHLILFFIHENQQTHFECGGGLEMLLMSC